MPHRLFATTRTIPAFTELFEVEEYLLVFRGELVGFFEGRDGVFQIPTSEIGNPESVQEKSFV